MTIEFSNAKPAKNQSTLSIVLLVVSCLFFFIPASLVVLGYYSSLPTGTLISPVPQGIISNNPPQIATDLPVVAAPEAEIAPQSATADTNSLQKTATLPANQKEVIVSDANISENSQIYILNKENDKSLYSVASKSAGQFTLSSNEISVDNRNVDYQIVNP